MLWQFTAIKYLLCVIVFMVPLYVSQSHLFPYATPKTLVLIMSAIVLAILYVWGRARERESVFNISYVHVALSTFITCLVISGFNGVNPQHAFFGDMTGMGIILLCAAALVASVLGYVIQKDRSFIVTLISWSLLSSVVMVAVLYGGESLMPRSAQGSTLGNNSYMGAYLLVNVCLALGLFITQKNLWQRILSASVGLFIIVSPIFFNHDIFKGVVSFADIKNNPLLLGGVANGAVMGLGGAMIIIGTLFLIRSKKVVFQWIGAISLIGVFVGIFVAGQIFMNPESSLHQSYAAEKNSNRFLFWDIASEASNDNPLLGWGTNGYSYAFQKHFSSKFFSPGYVPEVWTENPHNMFKEYQVGSGFIGLIAYLLLIGTTAISLFFASHTEDRKQKILSIIMFGALMGYVAQNLFIFDTTAPLLMFYIIVGYGMSVSHLTTIRLLDGYKITKIILSCLTIIFLVCIFFISVIKPWEESKAWARYSDVNIILKEKSPQAISNLGFVGDSAALADKVLDIFTGEERTRKMLGDSKDVQEALIFSVIKNLDEDLKKTTYPNFRAQWGLGRSYNLLIISNVNKHKDLIPLAREHLENAISINPENPNVYIDMSQTYLFEKKYSETEKWIRKAITVAPQYGDLYKISDIFISSGASTKEFQEYIINMKEYWCSTPRTCVEQES